MFDAVCRSLILNPSVIFNLVRMESIKVSQNGLRIFKQTAIIKELRSLKKLNAKTEKMTSYENA